MTNKNYEQQNIGGWIKINRNTNEPSTINDLGSIMLDISENYEAARNSCHDTEYLAPCKIKIFKKVENSKN